MASRFAHSALKRNPSRFDLYLAGTPLSLRAANRTSRTLDFVNVAAGCPGSLQLQSRSDWSGRRGTRDAAGPSLSYGDWIAKYDTPDDKIRILMLKRGARLALQPKLSIVMPVYNTDLRWLREAIESVRAQLYPHWELCISDDASTLPGVKRTASRICRQGRAGFALSSGTRTATFRQIQTPHCRSPRATSSFSWMPTISLPEDALYWVAEEIRRPSGRRFDLLG